MKHYMHIHGVGVLSYYIGYLLFSLVLLIAIYLPECAFRAFAYSTSDWVLIDDADKCKQEKP